MEKNQNTRYRKQLLPIFVAAFLIAVYFLWTNRPDTALPSARLQAPEINLSGFARAEGPTDILFPRDHGPHPEYLTEWWYYTGNLDSTDGRHFGFELTFFRRAAAPQSVITQDRESAWAADQIYLAHFSFADVAADQFYAYERFSRGAAGLAGAVAEPYEVWLEDWIVAGEGDGKYRLYAAQGDLKIELSLSDVKGPVLHGIDGYSQKGVEPGNASYYISQTRLEAVGSVEVGGSRYEVSGLSWMDHEYSTSALSPEQIGWDWFSIQLNDGTELMLFQLREEDGGIADFSSGSVIAADSMVSVLGKSDFSISVEKEWTSPESGATYPAGWTVSIPSQNIELVIEPYINNQELRVSFIYWEGAVRISGMRDGVTVEGSGYVELTGYAHTMQGEF